MSEERTQPASKRRRQMARQEGKAAHSPELTAAVGWAMAVVALGFFGDDLTVALARMVRGSIVHPSQLPRSAEASAFYVRSLMLGVIWPMLAILGSFGGGAVLAHQLQVRGLWATSQVAPDFGRLWRFSRGPGLSALFVQAIWSLAKGIVLVAVSIWVLRAGWVDFLRQGNLEGPKLAQAAGHIVLHVSRVLAGVLLTLGVFDYALRYRRFEAMLRTTPEEQREDQRVVEGDPAARAQRRRAARSMRGDSAELLAGAAFVLAGPGGLTLIVAGGPPPRRVSIRSVAKGGTGLTLRRKAEANGIPRVDDSSLAQRLARRPVSGSSLAAELIAELAGVWPS